MRSDQQDLGPIRSAFFAGVAGTWWQIRGLSRGAFVTVPEEATSSLHLFDPTGPRLTIPVGIPKLPPQAVHLKVTRVGSGETCISNLGSVSYYAT